MLVEQTELELADRELGIAGVIRIGAGETKSMRLVLDTFAELHRSHPGVTIELYTGNADAVEERLERGLLDFALLLEPVNVEKYEWIRMPEADRVGAVVAASGPWGGRDVLAPADVANMPLLVSSRTSNRALDLEAWSSGVLSVDELLCHFLRGLQGQGDLGGHRAKLRGEVHRLCTASQGVGPL